MENNRIIDKKFTRRGFLGGAVIGGAAFSLSSTLGATLPAYASTTHSTEESEESLPSGRQFGKPVVWLKTRRAVIRFKRSSFSM